MLAPELPELRVTAPIVNAKGLHARAASKLAKLAAEFDAEVWVMKDDMVVTARSLMGLMMLGAAQGSEIKLWARGLDAEAAMAALVNLIARRFDEEA
jgi:phosphocarrier protein